MGRNGKIKRNKRKVRRSINIQLYLEQAGLDYIDGKDEYEKGGFSQLVAEALKEKLGMNGQLPTTKVVGLRKTESQQQALVD